MVSVFCKCFFIGSGVWIQWPLLSRVKTKSILPSTLALVGCVRVCLVGCYYGLRLLREHDYSFKGKVIKCNHVCVVQSSWSGNSCIHHHDCYVLTSFESAIYDTIFEGTFPLKIRNILSFILNILQIYIFSANNKTEAVIVGKRCKKVIVLYTAWTMKKGFFSWVTLSIYCEYGKIINGWTTCKCQVIHRITKRHFGTLIKIKKNLRCQKSPGWNEVHIGNFIFSNYYVQNSCILY